MEELGGAGRGVRASGRRRFRVWSGPGFPRAQRGRRVTGFLGLVTPTGSLKQGQQEQASRDYVQPGFE